LAANARTITNVTVSASRQLIDPPWAVELDHQRHSAWSVSPRRTSPWYATHATGPLPVAPLLSVTRPRLHNVWPGVFVKAEAESSGHIRPRKLPTSPVLSSSRRLSSADAGCGGRSLQPPHVRQQGRSGTSQEKDENAVAPERARESDRARGVD